MPTVGGPEVHVPGAELSVAARLPDITTPGLRQAAAGRYTDPADWGSLHVPGTTGHSGVPGLQIDGYFPDTSSFNTTHGWNHDSQFVLRIPDHWNGRLVVSGAPGVRRQYACDFLISDLVVARGFAYAATDKGNSGVDFYRDGERPGDALAEWHQRLTELAVAAKDALRARFGEAPERTYLAGVSNGGYDAWFADPRSQPVHDALARVSLTGAIEKPLITLHGTLDALLPIGTGSDVYARMVAERGRDGVHRYYRIEGGNHVDSLVGLDPQHLRPMLPSFRTAFDALVSWVEGGQEPPPSRTVPRPAGNGATDPELLNSCPLS